MGTTHTPERVSAIRGWLPLLVGPPLVALLTPTDEPRWLFMWALAFTLYAGCKWLTWRRTPAPAAPTWRHAAYLLAWPGLDAPAFLRGPPLAVSRQPAPREWAFAAAKLLLGAGVLWGLVRFVPTPWPYLRGWAGMVGIALLLHFGLFHLLSCLWRSLGIEARPLMNAPLLATSVSDFWSKRWNTAFRDLTHRFLFRPLTARFGPRGAIVAGFLFSGVIHDLVISLPAGGGYGGPTLFFAIQAAALLAERSRIGQVFGLGRGVRGWLFTMMVLLGPAWLLFHPPFVERVVVPFLRALSAI